MPAHISGPTTDLEGLDDLESLWMELHGHHREVADFQDLVEDMRASWERRLTWYQRLIAHGASYLTAVDDGGQLVGYAMVALEYGPDDTFDAERGIAEVVTLVVARGSRSTGVGRALLRAAERLARDRGVDAMKIAVMSGNLRAQAFYENHGYRVGERILYRRLSES